MAELCDGWETGPDDSKSPGKLQEGVHVYRQAFAAAGRDPRELIVKSHLIPRRTDTGDIDWDATFSHVPAMLAAGVAEFAITMPIGMKAPLALHDIARFMNELASTARRY